ncbi:MAG: zinc ribbon domain-containing protein, partial [Solirubrobacteraceae bacterium]
MKTCPACGRPNTGESDFCVCGEFLDWTPEVASDVPRDASATMEAIPYEREVVGPTAVARPPGPAAAATATAPGPREEAEPRPPAPRPQFP